MKFCILLLQTIPITCTHPYLAPSNACRIYNPLLEIYGNVVLLGWTFEFTIYVLQFLLPIFRKPVFRVSTTIHLDRFKAHDEWYDCADGFTAVR